MKKTIEKESAKSVVNSENGFTALCQRIVNESCTEQVANLAMYISSAYKRAEMFDERYMQLQKDYLCAKSRFDAQQLKTLNADRNTHKAFKVAVAVAVARLAAETKTASWFNYRALYKSGYLDKMPKETNTGNKLASFIRDTYTEMLANQKRKAAAESKEAAIKAVADKFDLDLDTARKMYIAGVLKA